MKHSTIYSTAYETKGKLSVFGCEIKDLQDAALAVAAARNEASPLHPVNAPGTFAYMEGVAAIRVVFLQIDGWETHYCKGVEGVINKGLGLIVLFQNVDFACGIHDPNPISQKGEAVKDLVDNPSGYLWEHMAEEDRALENMEVWFFCVSSNGDDLRAELSRPREIKNGSFGTLAERVFIMQSDDWLPDPNKDSESGNERDADDFDVPVSKK